MGSGRPQVSGRRLRWARRENERRRRAYDAALARWQSDDWALAAMQETVRSMHHVPLPPLLPPVELRRGEVVLWTSPRVRLIELQGFVPLFGSGYAEFSLATVAVAATTATAQPVRDGGTAIVTNRRVIFRGGQINREWAFAKLIGFAHDSRSPATLINVSNRKKTSGLLLDQADVPGFRFGLTLGLADSVGDRAGLAAHLARLRVAHQDRLPAHPAPALPDQAPNVLVAALGIVARIYIGFPGMPRWLRVSQGLIAAFVSLAILGTLAGPPETTPASQTAPQPSASAGFQPTEATTGATPRRAPSARPTHTRTVRTAPAVKPKPTKKTRRPSPKPTRKPRLCGAPDNPFGYNFCGGSRVTSPDPGTCGYFNCIDYFDDGAGYMIQCRDGTFSMSGGRRGACSHHDGVRRTVFG